MIENIKLIRAYEAEHNVKILPDTVDYKAIKEAVRYIRENDVLKKETKTEN